MVIIKNIDNNKCLKWCLVRYLNPEDRNSAKITKTDKDFRQKLFFKDIKLPVKARDIHKIEKNNYVNISIFE